MLYSIAGKLVFRGENFAAVEAGSFGFKVFTAKRILESLPPIGSEVKFFCYLYVREDSLELYGFLNQAEERFFELLNSVAGIGPKSALSVMSTADLKNLQAAIKAGRTELLTKASGVGRKTAERIILELKNRVEIGPPEEIVKKMEADADIVEALVKLGYPRQQIRDVLNQIEDKIVKPEERLRAALKILARQ